MAWKNSYDKTQRENWVNGVYTVTVLFLKKKAYKKQKNHTIGRIVDIFIAFIHYTLYIIDFFIIQKVNIQ